MPPLNASLEQLLDYLKDKAIRYGEVAKRNVELAEIWKKGTDQRPPNLVFADRYEAAAKLALQLAQDYAGYALWMARLRPLDQLQPGEPALIAATFVRRASAEDFPGEAFIRLAGVPEPIRLPMQSAAQA
jgi:hypothetical protein